MSHRNRMGMTSTDLIVGLVLCVLMLAAFLPAAGVLDEARSKATCVSNLRNIGAAGTRSAGFWF